MGTYIPVFILKTRVEGRSIILYPISEKLSLPKDLLKLCPLSGLFPIFKYGQPFMTTKPDTFKEV